MDSILYTLRRPVMGEVLSTRIWGVPRPAWAVDSYSSGPPARGNSPNSCCQNLANDERPKSVQCTYPQFCVHCDSLTLTVRFQSLLTVYTCSVFGVQGGRVLRRFHRVLRLLLLQRHHRLVRLLPRQQLHLCAPLDWVSQNCNPE